MRKNWEKNIHTCEKRSDNGCALSFRLLSFFHSTAKSTIVLSHPTWIIFPFIKPTPQNGISILCDREWVRLLHILCWFVGGAVWLPLFLHSVNIIVNNIKSSPIARVNGLSVGISSVCISKEPHNKLNCCNIIHFIYDAKYWSISFSRCWFFFEHIPPEKLRIAFVCASVSSHCFGRELENPSTERQTEWVRIEKKEAGKNVAKTGINSNELTLHFALIKCNVVSSLLCIFGCNIFNACLFIQCLFLSTARSKLIWNIFKICLKHKHRVSERARERDLLDEIENSISNSS